MDVCPLIVYNITEFETALSQFHIYAIFVYTAKVPNKSTRQMLVFYSIVLFAATVARKMQNMSPV